MVPGIIYSHTQQLPPPRIFVTATMTAKKQVRIAVAQTYAQNTPANRSPEEIRQNGAFNSMEKNMLQTVKDVQEAAKNKADVIVFPEYWLQDRCGGGCQVSH